MSSARQSIESLRARQGKERHLFRGLIRRLTVGLSKTGLWQLLGVDGEVFDKVETFPGVGFASRPRAGKGEAIVVHVGGEDGHPVVIATRDRSIEVDLEEDSTAIYNSKSVIRITKAGDVVIQAAGTIQLGDGSTLGLTDGVVHGSGIDPFTGSTYMALGNTSAKVKAKK